MTHPDIEAMARAICRAVGHGPHGGHFVCPDFPQKCTVTPCLAERYGYARAAWSLALDCLNEPSESMWKEWRSINCEIGREGMEEFTRFYGDFGNWKANHQAMLDAKRKELGL